VVVELPGDVDAVESEVQAAAPKTNAVSANTTPPASVNRFPILANGMVLPFLVDSRSHLSLCQRMRVPLRALSHLRLLASRGCSEQRHTMVLLARDLRELVRLSSDQGIRLERLVVGPELTPVRLRARRDVNKSA